MSRASPEPTSREQRLHQVLAAYLAAVEAGQAPDRDALLRRHPDLATDLRSFFADHDRMRSAAAPIRALATAADTPSLPLAAATPPAGFRVRCFGDYELCEELGRGGMGVVYKARQRSLKRVVAVKMILSAPFATAAEIERFRREARALAKLDHPGIVPVYDIGEHEGQQYFSMKWIQGTNLSQGLPHFRANHRAAAFLLAKVARAIHAAHRRGILHRDLKPGNILLDASKQPYITDFGLAKRLDGASSLPSAGAVVGTASYMAPEQARGQTPLTPAADIYSLGAILYEMLTGQPPFRAETPLETLRQVVEREPLPPRKLNPKIHRDLEIICLKCLDKRPQRRYASAEKLAKDLENWVEGRPIQARRVGRAERAWLWCRRKPVLAALSATAALLLAVVAVAVPLSFINANRKAEADRAKAIAEKKAEDAKRKAEADRAKKIRREYLDDMTAANLAWGSNNYAEVRRLLQRWKEADFRGWEWYFLDAQCRERALSVRGHSCAVQAVAWSPEGKRLASADRRGMVRVWSLAADKDRPLLEIQTRTGGGVAGLAWSPDGKHLAAVCRRVLKIWEAGSGKEERSLPTADNSLIIKVPYGKAGVVVGNTGILTDTGIASLTWGPHSDKLALFDAERQGTGLGTDNPQGWPGPGYSRLRRPLGGLEPGRHVAGVRGWRRPGYDLGSWQRQAAGPQIDSPRRRPTSHPDAQEFCPDVVRRRPSVEAGLQRWQRLHPGRQLRGSGFSEPTPRLPRQLVLGRLTEPARHGGARRAVRLRAGRQAAGEHQAEQRRRDHLGRSHRPGDRFAALQRKRPASDPGEHRWAGISHGMSAGLGPERPTARPG
jgi:predicted Ser/Thr protein kinase